MKIKPANLRRVPGDEDEDRTPLLMAIRGPQPLSGVGWVLNHWDGVHHWVDRPDPADRVTPLMGCAFVENDDEAAAIAGLLIAAGARVETSDNEGGQCPLFMAAQQGKPKLLQVLIEHGARLDRHTQTSTSTPLWIASQNGHASCAAVLLKAATCAGATLTEATNNEGKTPALVAAELGYAQVVGALAQGGADLRSATPAYYTIRDPDRPGLINRFSPQDGFPKHKALDMAIRSHVGKTCCACGKAGDLKRCSSCVMVYLCSEECKKANWKLHKHTCSDLKAGRDLIAGAGTLHPRLEALGFEELFGPPDQISNSGRYEREGHAVWEYDAGARGQPSWQRYPSRIEENLESMNDSAMSALMGPAEKFMYRPGRPECDGMSEGHGRSRVPPQIVATRFVTFDDMTEREVYTGASRAVRRNDVRRRPGRPASDSSDE